MMRCTICKRPPPPTLKLELEVAMADALDRADARFLELIDVLAR